MKKFVCIACLTVAIASASYAAEAVSPVPDKTFDGVFDSVSTSGPEAKITLRDKNGVGNVFTVAKDAAITGADGKKTSLTWLVRGQKISVEYGLGKYGRKIARSIAVERE